MAYAIICTSWQPTPQRLARKSSGVKSAVQGTNVARDVTKCGTPMVAKPPFTKLTAQFRRWLMDTASQKIKI